MEYRDTKMQLAFFIIKLDFTLEIWNSTNYFEIDLWAFKTTLNIEHFYHVKFTWYSAAKMLNIDEICLIRNIILYTKYINGQWWTVPVYILTYILWLTVVPLIGHFCSSKTVNVRMKLL